MRDLMREALFLEMALLLATLSAVEYTLTSAPWASESFFAAVSFLNSLTACLSFCLRSILLDRL